MNKLKMLVLTALTAATVGTGALAAAPSASAMPSWQTALCAEIGRRLQYYGDRADEAEEWGWTIWARYFNRQASNAYNAYKASGCV